MYMRGETTRMRQMSAAVPPKAKCNIAVAVASSPSRAMTIVANAAIVAMSCVNGAITTASYIPTAISCVCIVPSHTWRKRRNGSWRMPRVLSTTVARRTVTAASGHAPSTVAIHVRNARSSCARPVLSVVPRVQRRHASAASASWRICAQSTAHTRPRWARRSV